MTDEHDHGASALFDDWQPLTDDAVRAGARPGESWEQDRERLQGLDKAEAAAGYSQWWHDRHPRDSRPRALLSRDLPAWPLVAPQTSALRDRAAREMGPWPHPAPLVRALGPGWKACAEVLPWEDTRRAVRYVVYCPAYGGELFVCRFQLFSPARWWCEQMDMGIAGVTHWRLAEDFDHRGVMLDGPPPVAPLDAEAMATLLHWWGWYGRYKGLLSVDD